MVDSAKILEARLLVVDDQEANVLLLERALGGAGYLSVDSTRDPRTVCELHRKNRYDLILLDLQMPVMDGFEVMEGLKQIEGDGYMPVLVITAQPDHKLRALRAGAKDFVSKPFDLAEVLMRVRNMLEVRLYAKTLAETVQALGASRDLIQVQNGEIKKLFDEVVAERKLSERRALHVAPGSIAARLPARAEVTEDAFSAVTVLIADVVGFAGLETVVASAKLEQIFALFDGLAVERGVKKIKTLGNSYLVASGVPVASADHAARAAHLALDMVETLDRFNQRTPATLQIRIGIATGDVSAGVIGRRLFLYDAWGDAVDVASRMESHGVAGRVQVSESARGLLREPFQLEERGTLEVPGMGEVRTWFLLGRNGAAA